MKLNIVDMMYGLETFVAVSAFIYCTYYLLLLFFQFSIGH